MSAAKPPASRAYLLRYLDGDLEPCAIVHAANAREARKQYFAIDGAEYMRTTAKRAPEFDNGVPSVDVLIRGYGWQFICDVCGGLVWFSEDEATPVVIEDRGAESKVAHAKCHAREVTP